MCEYFACVDIIYKTKVCVGLAVRHFCARHKPTKVGGVFEA